MEWLYAWQMWLPLRQKRKARKIPSICRWNLQCVAANNIITLLNKQLPDFSETMSCFSCSMRTSWRWKPVFSCSNASLSNISERFSASIYTTYILSFTAAQPALTPWSPLFNLFEQSLQWLWWHSVNQFHLFMPISIHPSLLHFLHPSPLHSFTLNSKLTFLLNPFCHRFMLNACLCARYKFLYCYYYYYRSVTTDTQDWLPWLMGPLLIIFSSWFFAW